jgi:hypothetical protein
MGSDDGVKYWMMDEVQKFSNPKCFKAVGNGTT